MRVNIVCSAIITLCFLFNAWITFEHPTTWNVIWTIVTFMAAAMSYALTWDSYQDQRAIDRIRQRLNELR